MKLHSISSPIAMSLLLAAPTVLLSMSIQPSMAETLIKSTPRRQSNTELPQRSNASQTQGTFLRGNIYEVHGENKKDTLDGSSTSVSPGGIQQMDNFAARSETTLTCWEDCTYHISGC